MDNDSAVRRVQGTNLHWYAVYTHANHEKSVADELERRSVESFLPLYSSKRRWKDRSVRLRLPLFPGYVFVHFSLHERLTVLRVPGVVRLVGFRNCAAQVPDSDINRIRTVLDQELPAQPFPYLTAGKRVRVISGPLCGLEGIVLRRKNGDRFIVSIELIQRAIAVDVDGLQLDLAGSQI